MLLIKDAQIFADGPKRELMRDETLSELFGVPLEVEERAGWYALAAGTEERSLDGRPRGRRTTTWDRLVLAWAPIMRVRQSTGRPLMPCAYALPRLAAPAPPLDVALPRSRIGRPRLGMNAWSNSC